MARITVEDCLPYVANRFDLVLLATKRARQIAMGSKPLIPEDGEKLDKPTVTALREIARGLIDNATLAAIDAREQGAEILARPMPMVQAFGDDAG